MDVAKRKNQIAWDGLTKELHPGVKLAGILETQESDDVVCLAFDRQGRNIASGHSDGVVRIWEVNGGRLLHVVELHQECVWSLAFDPSGLTLASASSDRTVKRFCIATGQRLRSADAYNDPVLSVAFDIDGYMIASGGSDETVKIWNAETRMGFKSLAGHMDIVRSVAYDPLKKRIASGSDDKEIILWNALSGDLLKTLKGHSDCVNAVAFHPLRHLLASGSSDKTIKIWDLDRNKLLLTLEGHNGSVDAIAFSVDGHLLVSKGRDQTIRIWNCKTWETVAIIPGANHDDWVPALAFNLSSPMIATAGPGTGENGFHENQAVYLWKLDLNLLLSDRDADEHASVISGEQELKRTSISYTSARVILVGDAGVGKTGLGWRLAHGNFKEHPSTHGQQFWLLNDLSKIREDGALCEAILWDLAGQPDYRLIHAVFLDDADIALLVFDPTIQGDLLKGVKYWLNQLNIRCNDQLRQGLIGTLPTTNTMTLLIAARCDRGSGTLTKSEIDDFCELNGINSYLTTSAINGDGVDELVETMKGLINWDAMPATVTTSTFKKIKDFVLALKEDLGSQKYLLTPTDLREHVISASEQYWEFSDVEMMTAVGHLENHGYVKQLRTSAGETRVLLLPELLNNLAASFVIEARRNLKGLGALEERRLLEDKYDFKDLDGISSIERTILIDGAVLLFMQHNICFRETNPLTGESFFIFPELINMKKPRIDKGQEVEDGCAYSLNGSIENVYASLVVLLGYTQQFSRTNQWQNEARYEFSDGQVCGIRQETTGNGDLNFVLYFGTNVTEAVRTLFQGLFESFLSKKNLEVYRYEPVLCSKKHVLNRSVLFEELNQGNSFVYCTKCGERIVLPKINQPIQFTSKHKSDVRKQNRIALIRSEFEQAVFMILTHVDGSEIQRPTCFISYAWGDNEQERWIEMNLATDLRKAGIEIVLDRWDNSKIGSSVHRFVERISECDKVLVVGTPEYQRKYMNNDPMRPFIVAAEGDLIGNRMIGSEESKASVLPLLLEGESKRSFPPILDGRVYADFRNPERYFVEVFELILNMYSIETKDPAVVDLRKNIEKKMNQVL